MEIFVNLVIKNAKNIRDPKGTKKKMTEKMYYVEDMQLVFT